MKENKTVTLNNPKDTAKKGLVLIGNMEKEDLLDVTEDKLADSRPYIIDFASTREFLRWNENASKPFLKKKWGVRIMESVTFNNFNSNYAHIIDTDTRYANILYVVQPKDRFLNINNVENKIFPIERTSKIRIDNVKAYIHEQLRFLPDETIEEASKVIFSRLGYSKDKISIYMPKLVEAYKQDFNLTTYVVRKIIPKRKLSSLENILFNILRRDYRFINEYYKLCDTYSERWVIDQYEQTLMYVIKIKADVSNGTLTFSKIRSNDKLSPYLRLVRDIPTSDLYHLYTLIKRYGVFAVELYLTSSSKDNINLLQEEFGYKEKER